MLANATLVAYAATTDAARARAFYEGTLGLACVNERPSFLLFQAGSAFLQVLVVQKVEAPGYAALGWNVPDLAATARELAAKGVSCHRYDGFEQDELGIWVAPSGSRVAWISDPDGHQIALTQLP